MDFPVGPHLRWHGRIRPSLSLRRYFKADMITVTSKHRSERRQVSQRRWQTRRALARSGVTRLVAMLAQAVTVSYVLSFLTNANAAEPQWWDSWGVIATSNGVRVAASDYAPITQGQLKRIAYGAAGEMGRLPGHAGSVIDGLIDAWRNAETAGAGNYYVAVNVGQLKAVALPFYNRLIEAQLTSGRPWEVSVTVPSDYAMATIGQAKRLFSFPIPIFVNPQLLPRITSSTPTGIFKQQNDRIYQDVLNHEVDDVR